MEFEQKNNTIISKIKPIKRSINVKRDRLLLQFPYVFIKSYFYLHEFDEPPSVMNYISFSMTGNIEDKIVPPLPNVLSGLQLCLGSYYNKNCKQFFKPKILAKKFAEFTIASFFESEFQNHSFDDWPYMIWYSHKLEIPPEHVIYLWQEFTKQNINMPMLKFYDPKFTEKELEQIQTVKAKFYKDKYV